MSIFAKNLAMEVTIIGVLIIILVSFVLFKLINSLKNDKSLLQDELNDLRLNYMIEREKVIKAEETLIAQRDKHVQQENYINELQQRFKLEFENIANRVLEDKSVRFTAQNRANLDLIINPLK